MKKIFLGLILVATTFSYNVLAGYKEGMDALRNSDYELALAILLPIARKGVARAQYNVGLLFHQGRGINQNFKEASHWYLAAANQGHTGAQNNIGSLFRRGNGVKQNYKLAAQPIDYRRNLPAA